MVIALQFMELLKTLDLSWFSAQIKDKDGNVICRLQSDSKLSHYFHYEVIKWKPKTLTEFVITLDM